MAFDPSTARPFDGFDPTTAVPEPGPTVNEQAIANRKRLSSVPLGKWGPDVWMGMRSIPDAGAQLLTRGLEAISPAGTGMERWAQGQRQEVERINAEAQQQYRQQYDPENTTGSSIAQGAGAAVVAGPILSRMAPAATFLGRTAQSAAAGGTQGTLTPVDMSQGSPDFWKEKAKQGGLGMAIGAATSPIAEAVGRVIAPRTSPQARQLMDEGVTPTPGQTLGGFWKAMEEKATSIPLLGDAIKAGQRRSLEDFNRAVYRRVLAPLGPEGDAIARSVPAGSEGIRKVGDTLSAAYESALAQSVPNAVTPNFQRAMNQLYGMVPRSQRDEFSDIVRREITAKVTPAGTITPSVAKEIESELGRLARQYSGSSTASERELARALGQAQQELRALVAENNPGIAPRIQAINFGWKQLTQLESAGAMLGAKEGVVTPAQFLNAVKKSDPSVRDRAFARGEVLNQDLARAGDAVLSQRVPDSGTTGRAIVGALGAGGLGLLSPTTLATVSAPALAYTPWGQRAAAAVLSRRPEFMREFGAAMEGVGPYLAAPITAGLLGSR